MYENPKERNLSTNYFGFKNNNFLPSKELLIGKEFFIKIINTLKSNNMDFFICQSLYIYRIKFILENNKKRKIRKSTIFDSNYEFLEDIEKVIPKIFKIFNADGQIIILSLFLLEKAIYKSKILLDETNLIKLVSISLIETIKFYIDEYNFDGNLICSILKIEKDMLVNLEINFLRYIDYKLKIDEDKFFLFKQKIIIPWIDYIKRFLS